MSIPSHIAAALALDPKVEAAWEKLDDRCRAQLGSVGKKNPPAHTAKTIVQLAATYAVRNPR